MGGSQIYIRGTVPPRSPLAEKFLYPKQVLYIFNRSFNFHFLALVVLEIIGGPKFKLGGLAPLNAPSGTTFVPEVSTLPPLIALLMSTFEL